MNRVLLIGLHESSCGTCRKGANPYEKKHTTCLGYGEQRPGCGVRWTHVQGKYPGTDARVAEMRPDLELIPGWSDTP